MAFFDKLNDLAKNIGDMTSDKIEEVKLNSKINSEKALIAEAFGKIGRICYEKHAAGEFSDPETAELMASVDRCYAAIKETEEQIRMLKESETAAANSAQTAPAAGVVCPACGRQNSPNTKFCGDCGAKLEASAPPQPKLCPSCQAPVPNGVKFCNECGAKIE